MIGHELFAGIKALRLFAGLDEFGDGFPLAQKLMAESR
jgi:hypothetical protein